MEILISILIFVGFFALSLALVAFMSYLICIGFGIAWSWPLAIGIWALCIVIRWVISAARNGD